MESRKVLDMWESHRRLDGEIRCRCLSCRLHILESAARGLNKGSAWAQRRLVKMLKRFTNGNDVGCPARRILVMCSSWTLLSRKTASQWCRRISFDARWSQGYGGESWRRWTCMFTKVFLWQVGVCKHLDKGDLMHLSTFRTDGWAML